MTTDPAGTEARDRWGAMPRSLAAVTTAAFLLTVGSVPLVQAISEVRQALASGAAGADLWPASLDVTSLLPRFGREKTEGSWLDPALAWLPAEEELRAFEDTLESGSFLRDTVVPLAQIPLLRLGAGNEQVYLGKDGWLFYREDVDHVTGPAFLEADRDSPVSDPVTTLVDFRRQLAGHGVELLVVPVPVKPTIHPEKLSRRFADGDGPVHNPSFAAFVEELAAAGVPVLDLAPAFMALKDSGEPVYLATDTHWRPETVRAAAVEVAKWIRVTFPDLRRGAAPAEPAREVRVANLGDTARMLKLPDRQELYAREAAVLRPVEPAPPERAPASGAPVLVLGDSFSNIYSLPAMGWGAGAGLVEYLGHELGVPVESIRLNAGGSFAIRGALARRAAREPGLLGAARLVVYEFATRELSYGDWRRVEIP